MEKFKFRKDSVVTCVDLFYCEIIQSDGASVHISGKSIFIRQFYWSIVNKMKYESQNLALGLIHSKDSNQLMLIAMINRIKHVVRYY